MRSLCRCQMMEGKWDYKAPRRLQTSKPYDAWDDCIFTDIYPKNQPNAGKYTIQIHPMGNIFKTSPKISQRHCQPKSLLLKNIVQLGLGSTCLLLEDHLLLTDLSHLRSPRHLSIHHIGWLFKVIKNSQTECLRCTSTNHWIQFSEHIVCESTKKSTPRSFYRFSFAIPELSDTSGLLTATKTHDGYASVHPPGEWKLASTRRHHRVTPTKFT